MHFKMIVEKHIDIDIERVIDFLFSFFIILCLSLLRHTYCNLFSPPCSPRLGGYFYIRNQINKYHHTLLLTKKGVKIRNRKDRLMLIRESTLFETRNLHNFHSKKINNKQKQIQNRNENSFFPNFRQSYFTLKRTTDFTPLLYESKKKTNKKKHKYKKTNSLHFQRKKLN